VNPAAQAILPRAEIGMHYSTMIRASAFVAAMEEILDDRKDSDFTFTLMMERERFFEARASMLPAGAVDFGDEDHVIFQIEDRTRDKASLQARTDFVANASHELRTPLASILGYIETLQGHAREDPEARELFLDIMMKQASRMQRLVDDLMNLSRIEMNAHIRPEEPLDLHALAAEAAHALFPLATQNDVILQIEIVTDADGPIVLGDRDQLSQVIVNLVDNAIKYGGRGQKVRVYPAEPSPKYPGHAGISVRDTGPGIARENVHRLTERFFRVNAGQSRDKGGTGLGLAITKHILNRHSGALGIESIPGDGSTFTLWLPLADRAALSA
ncbi:MAG: ATP-binding protein, partial [Pseudomonadota bacterium]